MSNVCVVLGTGPSTEGVLLSAPRLGLQTGAESPGGVGPQASHVGVTSQVPTKPHSGSSLVGWVGSTGFGQGWGPFAGCSALPSPAVGLVWRRNVRESWAGVSSPGVKSWGGGWQEETSHPCRLAEAGESEAGRSQRPGQQDRCGLLTLSLWNRLSQSGCLLAGQLPR